MSGKKFEDLEVGKATTTTKNISLSQSAYEKLNEMMGKSPTTVITSICALFIVLILSVTLPLYIPSLSS